MYIYVCAVSHRIERTSKIANTYAHHTHTVTCTPKKHEVVINNNQHQHHQTHAIQYRSGTLTPIEI